MSTYTYSLSVDFTTNAIDTDQFTTQVNDSSITISLNGIEVEGDVVRIIFASALSGAEQTTLDALVTAHIPISDAGSLDPTGSAITMMTLVNEVSPTGSSYIEVGRFTWDDTRYINFRSGIVIFKSRITGVSGIDIQVWDNDNSFELGMFTSSTSEFGTFTFINPSTDAEILIRVRRTTQVGSRPYIDSLSTQFIN